MLSDKTAVKPYQVKFKIIFTKISEVLECENVLYQLINIDSKTVLV